MMLLEERTVLQTAIDTYGREVQTMKAVEEFGELASALMRLRCLIRTRPENDEAVHKEWDHVVEEIADVEIMLRQLRMIYDDSEVDGIRASKLRRLAERLNLIKKDL